MIEREAEAVAIARWEAMAPLILSLLSQRRTKIVIIEPDGRETSAEIPE